jgi:hypothetical protein
LNDAAGFSETVSFVKERNPVDVRYPGLRIFEVTTSYCFFGCFFCPVCHMAGRSV